MADILELALSRVLSNGMSQPNALQMLEEFARGEGRDIEWQGIAPHLSKDLRERIDRKAVGWLLSHAETAGYGIRPKEPPHPVRDGKMLATGEER